MVKLEMPGLWEDGADITLFDLSLRVPVTPWLHRTPSKEKEIFVIGHLLPLLHSNFLAGSVSPSVMGFPTLYCFGSLSSATPASRASDLETNVCPLGS